MEVDSSRIQILSDAESRYVIIELKTLAVAWAISKCHIFLAGLQQFQVVTDHHPLIPILNSHRLNEIENPRLQRLKTKLMGYNLKVEWLKGDQNKAPDALSCYPYSDPSPHDNLADQDMDDDPAPALTHIRAVATPELDNLHLMELQQASTSDAEYQKLRHYIIDGFPKHRHELPDECKPYRNIQVGLSIEDDLIVFGHRLVIPHSMIRKVLQQLHKFHQGQVRTKQRAQLAVYWPNITNNIDNIILSCKTCQDKLPSHPKETVILKPQPERPFQEIAINFCTYAGQQYLINIVDCFSNWPEIVQMQQNTTTP